jgi:D-beta-D-heptose 7-phosphate kinase/D-beta-D-heptose 1-phosphate adenosyltransferase
LDRLTADRVEEILRAARDIRALVVGDLMLDKYIIGTVDRISPEAPVPVLHVEHESSAMGGAANVAANIVALGAGADVVGCVADDEAGRTLQAGMEAAGVGTAGLVVVPDRPTTVKTRVLARHQQVVRVDRENSGDVSEAVAGRLVQRLDRLASSCDVLVLEDYNKGVLVPEVIDAALEVGQGRGIPTVVDPKRLRFRRYAGATVFKPNAKELAESLGDRIHPDDPAWMESTRRSLACEVLLLTLGEEGMALSADDAYLRVPAVARDVYDVSGAGDTVTAVMAVTIAAGASVEEAAVLANHAAALEVGRAGVVTVSAQEVLDQVRRFGNR